MIRAAMLLALLLAGCAGQGGSDAGADAGPAPDSGPDPRHEARCVVGTNGFIYAECISYPGAPEMGPFCAYGRTSYADQIVRDHYECWFQHDPVTCDAEGVPTCPYPRQYTVCVEARFPGTCAENGL